MKKLFSSRILRQGGAATAITILVVVVAVLLNLVVGALSDRFGLSIDMTENQVLTLSDETKTYIATVDKPVDIIVFRPYEYFSNSGNPYYEQAAEMINGIGQQNSNITVQYIDIVSNPAYATQYPDLALDANSILVKSDATGRTQKLTLTDLFNTQFDSSTYSTYITSSKAEQAISSAILNVTSDDLVKVSVISGHNEADVSAFTSLLAMNGFEVDSVDLLTGELDPETDVLIMAAPERDLTEDETRKLDTFLNNDGRLGKTFFYLAGPEQQDASDADALPNLAAFLADWGVEVLPGVVYETDTNKLFYTSYLATLADYAESDYSAEAQAKGLPMAMPTARPMEVLFTERSSATVTTLLQFSADAGVMPADATNDFFQGDLEASGPYPALVLASRLTYDQLTPLNSYVLTCSSVAAVGSSYIGSASFANGTYFVSLLNRLAGREQTFSVQNRTITRTELPITAAQAYTLGIALTIVLPLALLAAGIIIWVRRRHR